MGLFNRKKKEDKGVVEPLSQSTNGTEVKDSTSPLNNLDEVDIDALTKSSSSSYSEDSSDDSSYEEDDIDIELEDGDEDTGLTDDSSSDADEDADEEEEEVPVKRGLFGAKPKKEKKKKGLTIFTRKSKSQDAEIYVLADYKRYGMISYFKEAGTPIYSLHTKPDDSMNDILDTLYSYEDDELPKVQVVIIDSGKGRFISKTNLDLIKTIVETAFKDVDGSEVLICSPAQQIVSAVASVRDKIKAEGNRSIKEFNARIKVLPNGVISEIPKHIDTTHGLHYKINEDLKDELEVERIATEIYPKIDIPVKLQKKLKDRKEVILDIPVYSANTPEISIRQYGTMMKGENGKPLVVETEDFSHNFSADTSASEDTGDDVGETDIKPKKRLFSLGKK